MSVAGPILKLRPSNFAKSYNFYRCINDISITFWYLKWFQIYKKSHPTSYPVLESSLDKILQPKENELNVIIIEFIITSNEKLG